MQQPDHSESQSHSLETTSTVGTSDDWKSSGEISRSTTSTAATATEKRIPERCLSFELRGPFAHFRRIEGNVVKQTYRIIPRTTLAGLCAAILGLGRDTYYDIFRRDRSRVAIEPLGELRSLSLPQLSLSTAGEKLETHGSSRTVKITIPRPEEPRQQHNYDVLVDPAYRVDLWLDEESVYSDLRDSLAQGRSYYTPSLGLSEHLAAIEYLGEFTPEPVTGSELAVDSAVPNATDEILVQPGVQWSIERSPAFMKRRNGGRVTTGFTTYAYRPDAGPLTLGEVECATVDDRVVMFI